MPIKFYSEKRQQIEIVGTKFKLSKAIDGRWFNWRSQLEMGDIVLAYKSMLRQNSVKIFTKWRLRNPTMNPIKLVKYYSDNK